MMNLHNPDESLDSGREKQIISQPPIQEKTIERLVYEEQSHYLTEFHESLNRESSLQRQMRNMKRHLMSIALKFKIVEQVHKDDIKTIQYLRNEALKAKVEELIASKQVSDANDLIQSLKLEVSSLRRTLAQIQAAKARSNFNFNDLNTNNDGEHHAHNPSPNSQPTVWTSKHDQIAPEGSATADAVLSFEQWKINKWVNPTKKNHISDKVQQTHESHVIDLLADAATKESLARLSLDSSVVAKVRAGKKPASAYYEAVNSTSAPKSLSVIIPGHHSDELRF